jgi:hypothetical protein
MTAEAKLYYLAKLNTQLVSDLTNTAGVFQYFDTQLAKGYIQPPLGSVLRVQRISTQWDSNMGGTTPLTRIRFQFDVLDYDVQNGRSTVKDIIAWLNTVDLCSTNQFQVPTPTPGPQSPCFILNQRQTIKSQLEPLVYVQSLDARIANREDQ